MRSYSEEELEERQEAYVFVQSLRRHVRNLALDETFAERIGRAVAHYEKMVEHSNIGSASGDANWDAE